MEKILIIEDSKIVSRYLKRLICSCMKDIEVIILSSYQELKDTFENTKNFSIALVDIHLPDVHDLTLVNFLLKHNIPSIVMTSTFNDNLYSQLKHKRIIDFVLKDSMNSLDYIVTLTKRMLKNRNKTVLVVDDSQASLNYIKSFLDLHLFNVILEKEPQKALEIIKEKDISLVITDYYMPGLNGTELIQKVRRFKSKDELEIMGISSDEASAIHFLKFGANDFIQKPFLKEEFLHRVNNLAQQQDDIFTLKSIINTDYLTKIYNRKYFFEEGKKYFDMAKKENIDFTVAMIDIDDFKNINDTYGHDVGDKVIKSIAETIKDKTKGEDIVARFGGEEFAILLKNISFEDSIKFFKEICKTIENTKVYIDDESYINATVSIGITSKTKDTLEKMLKVADNRLYIAKSNGKNMVVFEDKKEAAYS